MERGRKEKETGGKEDRKIGWKEGRKKDRKEGERENGFPPLTLGCLPMWSRPHFWGGTFQNE